MSGSNSSPSRLLTLCTELPMTVNRFLNPTCRLVMNCSPGTMVYDNNIFNIIDNTTFYLSNHKVTGRSKF
jgi:hypothetical protein